MEGYFIRRGEDKRMSGKLPAIAATVVMSTLAAVAFAQTPTVSNDTNLPSAARYLPQYTASGELILPKDYREWVFVGSPLTPNALNNGHSAFPEYHNVYIEPGSYAIYKKTGVFPEGTIFYKELQLTLKPEENPDGSRTEPSGRGFFPGMLAGAEVSVKDTKRFAASGGWGYFEFGHSEPKLASASARAESECAYCHINSAKRDLVWTQFYRILDEVPLPTGKGG
jgi:hypothetical protein